MAVMMVMVMMIVVMITYLRIDAHVDNAVEYTTRASADTKKALEYQQKARRWDSRQREDMIILQPIPVFRKKIMMILCVLISAPLGTWMGLKYIGIM